MKRPAAATGSAALPRSYCCSPGFLVQAAALLRVLVEMAAAAVVAVAPHCRRILRTNSSATSSVVHKHVARQTKAGKSVSNI